jgi:hypothetical protein
MELLIKDLLCLEKGSQRRNKWTAQTVTSELIICSKADRELVRDKIFDFLKLRKPFMKEE